jgi:hypothetical protein
VASVQIAMEREANFTICGECPCAVPLCQIGIPTHLTAVSLPPSVTLKLSFVHGPYAVRTIWYQHLCREPELNAEPIAVQLDVNMHVNI